MQQKKKTNKNLNNDIYTKKNIRRGAVRKEIIHTDTMYIQRKGQLHNKHKWVKLWPRRQSRSIKALWCSCVRFSNEKQNKTKQNSVTDCNPLTIVAQQRIQVWTRSHDHSHAPLTQCTAVQITSAFTKSSKAEERAGSVHAGWLNNELNRAAFLFFLFFQTTAFTLPLAQSPHTKSGLVICIYFASTTNCRCHCVADCNYPVCACVCMCTDAESDLPMEMKGPTVVNLPDVPACLPPKAITRSNLFIWM